MELLQAFHIPLYEFDDYEADDIIGTLARKAQAAGVRAEIISGDLDMLQIVDDHIKMYQLKRGFSDVSAFDIAAVEEKYGLKQSQFLDLKALKGDSSDNIPGVPGIGEKGAVKLLQEYGTLENLYDHVDEVTGATGKKLVEGKELAFISKQLAQIQFDAPLEFDPQATKLADFDKDQVVAELKKLQFNSLLRKFVKLFPGTSLTPAVKATTIPEKSVDQPTKNVVENTTVTDIKVEIPENLYLSYNVKQDMHDHPKLAREIEAGRPYWDLGQVEFLLDPLVRKSAQLSLVDMSDPKGDYVYQKQRLASLPRLEQVAEELDLPLIPVLYSMETAGVKIDHNRFKTLEKEFSAETKELEQQIYQLAGKSFNVNSPIQLSEILFDTLQLPTQGIKKTQRAYSTGAKELDKLRELHPIIAKIERYREVNKLLTTYVTPLPGLADEYDRIHTTYTQDVTATGRLSSVSPNLQNIPVRSEDGKRIRNCFVTEKGKSFVSADYAQFELRLAAALAGDQKLIDDFNAGLDIHTKTAADAFHIPMDQVTKAQRRAAKVINFGVLYGMSPKGLADAADMSFYEAKHFIEDYFKLRAPIRKYLDDTLAGGRQNGYVETMFGRRRPCPDLSAPNYLVRSAAERAAANMPIQGTEADLMKKAMLAVNKALPKGAEIILQIHDSLIIECFDQQVEEVKQLLIEKMENVAPELPVKLAVDATTGKDWGEL
jgi:DNA polymerase-1